MTRQSVAQWCVCLLGVLACVQGRLADTIANLVGSLRSGQSSNHDAPFSSTAAAATQSMKSLMNGKKAGSEPAPVPHEVMTVNFGTKTSPVRDGERKDYGLPYTEHAEFGIGWGWNCDLHQLGSTRLRDHDEDEYLRSLVIPDRHGKCDSTPVWKIGLPAGDYTVRFSASDPDAPQGVGFGCVVQGVKIGDLPAENSCSQGPDTSCTILPRVTVKSGEGLRVGGSHAQGCESINYISFYVASNETATALSAFVPLETNVVDSQVLAENAELDKFLSGIADENRNVIVTSVNKGYIDFAMNWLCSISKMNLSNYFLVATDHESYEYLEAHGFPVFEVKPSGAGEGIESAVKYGTVEYQELILQRTKLVNKVLHLGYNLLLCDIDAVWLQNPLPYLSDGYDVQGQPEADGRLCGGFMYLLSTPGVQKLWQQVTDRHQDIVTKAEKRGKLQHIDESEQELLLKLLPSSGLKVKSLDGNMFPHGLKYFGPSMTFRSQMDLKHIKPAVVHNNYVIGKDNKVIRFKHFGLWFVGDKASDYKCTPP